MPKHQIKICFLFTTLFFLLVCSDALAQFEIIEPSPFRADSGQLEGRDFTYGAQGFVDRFSYRFDPENRRRWLERGEGFRITAGSVSKNETYSAGQFKKQWFFDENVFGVFRFQQNEDYDSDYDEFLYGFGYQFLDNWSFTTLTNIFRDKEDIDLQLELKWEQHPVRERFPFLENEEDNPQGKPIGHFARLALILSDPFFNGASEEGNYKSGPQTIFFEANIAGGNPELFHFWINYTPEVELEFARTTHRYEQLTIGARSDIYLSEKTNLILEAIADYGTREKEILVGGFRERDLDRENLNFTAELWREVTKTFRLFSGLRYLYFVEDDLRPLNQVITERDEKMVFAGLKQHLSERVVFRPTLFLNSVDNTDDFFSPLEDDRKDDKLLGRVIFPFEYHFPRMQAIVAINPTLEWPGDPFGGLNIQVQFEL